MRMVSFITITQVRGILQRAGAKALAANLREWTRIEFRGRVTGAS